ncbi:flagellar biosynthesis anti-sigma factor FlgM [Ferrimonas pelagia]|uniref:Negative regulator of flagellin synthesis n=1 Tax=Ferrimonas pelagia TaxID=1177826 RepID=A0ABP9EW20_9GAMM
MEINKLSNNYPVDLKSAPKRTIAQPEQAAVAAERKDSISDDWQLLEQANQELSQLADVDMDKVNAMRAALKDGSFELDLADLAGQMLGQHS